MARIAIVGAGYVGVCTGVAFAELGHEIAFYDVQPGRLDSLRRARAPFYEQGVDEALARHRDRARAATSLEDALADADHVMLCVGTPSRADGSIDLASIVAASEQVGGVVARRTHPPTVIVKSTVVPGTARTVVAPALAKAAGRDVPVVSNPEFLKEGSALADALRPDRIVVGAASGDAARSVLALYEGLPGERILTSPDTAEMIKYVANAFLATKIAFANEMANVAERIGVDWNEVVRGIGPDPRIGPLFLRAGLGFGGSCFPKDIAAIARLSERADAPSGILQAVLENNTAQPLVALRMLRDEIGDLRGLRVALLGLAFKPGTDDVRESRALPLWRALTTEGAVVTCHDPQARASFLTLAPEARIVDRAEDALQDADAAILVTEWPEYAALDPRLFPRVVVDGRRALDASALRARGVRVRGIGMGAPSKAPST